MLILFSAAMFVNALLLFFVQPMFAKLLLPLFGGSPAVWTTCMLFFQSALLAGYFYSHALVKLRFTWQQVVVHVAVVALPVLVLPIAVSSASPGPDQPIAEVLWLSTISVGAPFFALATSAPLLQHWFARAHRARPVDPYFLYAASNLGSFASLLLYPSVIEPGLRLSRQTAVWAIAYGAAAVLTMVCAVVTWQRASSSPAGAAAPLDGSVERIAWMRRSRWIALAFVPSSLMLAVTSYLTTDIAAVPLLWVAPLALYLLTFVITFSQYGTPALKGTRRVFPLLILVLIWLLVGEARLPLAAMASAHLLTFFILALLCHGSLAEDRPPAAHLTDFYLALAIGGALGGLFNTLVAPLLFTGVLEYPLVLAAGLLLLAFRPGIPMLRNTPRWWLRPALAAILTAIALSVPGTDRTTATISWTIIGLATVVCLGVSKSPRGFAAATAAMLAVYLAIGSRAFTDVVYASRTFFGTYRVASVDDGRAFTLFHGTTIHGRQNVGSDEPLTYYHRESPIAEVLATRPSVPRSVGAIGLGAGALAAYAKPGQRWMFYEIDPEVERIARDARYFTHLRACGAICQVVIGDARLTLERRPEVHDVLVVDAFSSDAIPIHLLTREALGIYLSRLSADGVIAMHISNIHLDLVPVVAGVMREHGLVGRSRYQSIQNNESGRYGSHWTALARTGAALGTLPRRDGWVELEARGERPWTDDFSNIWSVLRWRQ